MPEEIPTLCSQCATRLGIAEYEDGECEVCGGIMDDMGLADAIDPTFEYHSFNVGVVLPPSVSKREKELVTGLRLKDVRGIKAQLNAVLRERISKRLGKEAVLVEPDVVFEIDYVKKRVFFRIKSLTLYGRYCKYERGIPQTKWYCTRCRGKGCKHCNFEGKMYPTSVEEIVAEPILALTAGRESRFHGAGREDIDVRMLGDGRPFVIEIIYPKKRTLDLAALRDAINGDGRVSIGPLSYCEKGLVEKIKNGKFKKTYVAYLDQKLNDDEIKNVKTNIVGEIQQRTPIRVSHRRSDKIRKRKVYKVLEKNNTTTELEIYCDGGLYIKELISGDEGRTVPSVTDIVGRHVLCEKLDVIKIHCED